MFNELQANNLQINFNAEIVIENIQNLQPQNIVIPKDKGSLLTLYSHLTSNLNDKFQNLKCIQGNDTLSLCCNNKCQQNALMCGIKNCLCQAKHKMCFYNFRPDVFLESVQRKLQKESNLLKQLQTHFQLLIDKISEFRDKTMQNAKYMLFSRQQKQFIQNLLQRKTTNLKGQLLSKCFQELINKETSYKQDQNYNQTIEASKVFNESIKDLIEHYESSIPTQLTQNVIPLKIKQCDSKILRTRNDYKTLQSFFNEKKMKGLNLLYRASQNQFLTQRFYQKCKDIPNTLFIVRTDFGKIIGGFTPLTWRDTYNYQKSDSSKQTFIFSLTNKDKFILSDQNYAIYSVSQNAPRFGLLNGADFGIDNGQSGSHYVFRQMLFKNNKYFMNNKQSFKLFTGSDSSSYSISEWEVYEVLF